MRTIPRGRAPGWCCAAWLACSTADAMSLTEPSGGPWRSFARSSTVALIDCGDVSCAGDVTECSVLESWKGTPGDRMLVVTDGDAFLGDQEGHRLLLVQDHRPGDAVRVLRVNRGSVAETDAFVVGAASRGAVSEHLDRRRAAEALDSDEERSEAYWAAVLAGASSPDPVLRRWAGLDAFWPKSPWGHRPADLAPFVATPRLAGLFRRVVFNATAECPSEENVRALLEVCRADPAYGLGCLRLLEAQGIPPLLLEWKRSRGDDG